MPMPLVLYLTTTLRDRNIAPPDRLEPTAMRTESQVFPSFAHPDRLLLAALLLAGAIALAACGNANGDSEKDGKEKVAGRTGRSRGDAARRDGGALQRHGTGGIRPQGVRDAEGAGRDPPGARRRGPARQGGPDARAPRRRQAAARGRALRGDHAQARAGLQPQSRAAARRVSSARRRSTTSSTSSRPPRPTGTSRACSSRTATSARRSTARSRSGSTSSRSATP